jgi:hypothetical protein
MQNFSCRGRESDGVRSRSARREKYGENACFENGVSAVEERWLAGRGYEGTLWYFFR